MQPFDKQDLEELNYQLMALQATTKSVWNSTIGEEQGRAVASRRAIDSFIPAAVLPSVFFRAKYGPELPTN